MLRIVLLISILALFGDCVDKGKRKAGGISINELIVNEVKEKAFVATSRKGKEKVGEKINVMDTTEHIAQMNITQDKAKMDLEPNAKPKANEKEALPKYVFIWSDNEKKNLEVDHKVIRLSKELSELFHAKDDQSVDAKHGEQETLPVPKQEAEKMVKEWYAHHKNDEHKTCKDNVTLVIKVHLDAVRLSKELSNMLEESPTKVRNSDGLKKITDVPTVSESSATKVQEGEVGEASPSNAKAGTIAEEIQKFVPPPHTMQWDVKTDLEMVRAADFYNINRLINDDYIDNVYEIVKVKWINGKTPQEIRKAFGVEEPYPPGHPEWARVEKENEWEESDEEREARHAKEREEEDERERKEKKRQEEAERVRQVQQQNQEQNQEQPHQQGQHHDEGQGHDEDDE
ncbi:hypothetical protein niasHT_012191 [Heterodera trifolii]|uniref:SKP1 component dimerisation domain-containing protein n=1 Tax=Heterodera trifolii TaxID=157864 RepID=A0ABD2KUT9_9BILA